MMYYSSDYYDMDMNMMMNMSDMPWTMTVANALADYMMVMNPIAIVDKAAAVQANLDGIEMIAQNMMQLASITFSDPGAPVLSIGIAQWVNDNAALQTIMSPYSLALTGSAADVVNNLGALRLWAGEGMITSLTVHGTGVSAGVANFLQQQDNLARVESGLPIYVAVPPGGSSAAPLDGVIGFQTATLFLGDIYGTQARNVMVLDNPRSGYAIQSDAFAHLTVQDLGSGQSVTVGNVSAVIFNAAATDSAGNYPDMLLVANGVNSLVAEFYKVALGHLPDLPGLEYWEGRVDNPLSGVGIQSAAGDFLAAGGLVTDSAQAFLAQLSANSAHQLDMSFWQAELASGDSRANILINIAEQPDVNSGWLIDALRGQAGQPFVDTAQVNIGGNTLTVAANSVAETILLSAATANAVLLNGGDQLYSSGNGSITVLGANNGIHLAGGSHDSLNLAGGVGTVIGNFVPGGGATLHLADGGVIVHEAGSFGDGSAAAVSAAIIPVPGFHGAVIYLGEDAAGNAEAWLTLNNGTPLSHIATLVGVNQAALSSVDFA